MPSVAEPAPVHSAPDPVAYELAAFELNVPVQAATAPVPSDAAHLPAEALPEPAVERIEEPAAAAAPPAWSYEQVARIEHTDPMTGQILTRSLVSDVTLRNAL